MQPRLLLRSVRLLLSWFVRGKGTPVSFFDTKTGRPLVAPEVLSAGEWAALKERPVPA
jgi:hypothetical protein